jgi:hypothetical protein
MWESEPRRGIRPSRVLGLFAIVGALGGIALVSRPTPARRVATGGSPLVISLRPLQVPSVPGPPVDAPRLLAPEELGPTDRCLIEPPQVDDRFAFPAPRVDDRFVVKPLVQGLPVSAAASRSRR